MCLGPREDEGGAKVPKVGGMCRCMMTSGVCAQLAKQKQTDKKSKIEVALVQP